MWKDFFYYSKAERRAVYALSVLIALLVIALICLPEPVSRSTGGDKVEQERLASAIREREKQPRRVLDKEEHRKVVLAPFNPNLADSIELSKLGLSRFVVRNILKYRQKGGSFTTPESFARIYGLTEEKYTELKPYIRIPAVEKKQSDTKEVVAIKVERKDILKHYKYPEGTLVDVTVADTAELKKIPGIGSGIAKAIVGYRNRLGGFCRLEQLSEVKYVTPEMMKWFKLEQSSVQKISINRASLDKLRSHPYLNFYQAKVIVEHRKKKGELKSLSQLSLYEEFTEKDLMRLADYVSFD